MKLEILLLFSLGIVLNVYSFFKIFKREDLNIFDVFGMFQSLFFVFIPIKAIIEGIKYRDIPFKDIVEQHPTTLIYYVLFTALITAINILITKLRAWPSSVIHLTNYTQDLDKKTFVDSSTIYLSIAFLCFYLYPLISYGNLNVDNLEGNVTYQYALNIPIYQRMIILTSANCFPAFVVMVIKYYRENKVNNKTRIAIILIFVCALLGQRTVLLYVIVVALLYLYSVDRRIFSLKKSIFFGAVFVVVTTVVFPASHAFRLTKQNLIASSYSHSFLDVIVKLINLNDVEFSDLLNEADDDTKGRSLNVYIALDEACYNSYSSTDGALIMDQIQCVVPIIKPNPELDNIIGNSLEGFGSDVGESILTFFIFDIGFIGIFVAPLYFFIYIFLNRMVRNFFYLFFNDRRIDYIYLTIIIQVCYAIEFVPSIRYVYNPFVFVYATFAILLAICKLFVVHKNSQRDSILQ